MTNSSTPATTAPTIATTASGGSADLLHHDRQKHHTKKDGPLEYNIFRDSMIRYLGYANEVGESFRYQFPKLVMPSYVVAFGYCLADSVTSGYQAYEQQQQQQKSKVQQLQHQTQTPSQQQQSQSTVAIADATIASVDTLLWQSLASVAIPGLVIHQIVKWSRVGLTSIVGSSKTMISKPPFIVTWGPTMLGLASIPLIIHPIDMLVDEIMDHTFRSIDWKKHILGYNSPATTVTASDTSGISGSTSSSTERQ